MYTKGPWKVGDTVTHKEQAFIADLCDCHGDCVGLAIIANVPTESVVREQAKANAHLIAAAPALLEACKQAVCGNMGWKGKLKYAIALAEKGE